MLQNFTVLKSNNIPIKFTFNSYNFGNLFFHKLLIVLKLMMLYKRENKCYKIFANDKKYQT